MRPGSGGILLIGFAVVVMIITLAAYVNPATVQVKTDPSQDFVYTLAYVNQYAKVAANMPDVTYRSEFLNSMLRVLRTQLKTKGIEFQCNDLSDTSKIRILFSLKKGSTSFSGLIEAKVPRLSGTFNESNASGSGGGSSSSEGPLIFVPSKLCLLDIQGLPLWPKSFFIFNPTTQGYDANMTFVGPDGAWPWFVISYNWPPEIKYGSKSWWENSSSVEFYIPPAREHNLRLIKVKTPGTASAHMVMWKNPWRSGNDTIYVYLPSIDKFNKIDAMWCSDLQEFVQCEISNVKEGLGMLIPTFGGG